MNNLFALFVFISLIAVIVFAILTIVNFTKDKNKGKKTLKRFGISFGVLIVSFILFGATMDESEVSTEKDKKIETSSQVKEETTEEKQAREAKETEEKAAAEQKAKEKAEADAKAKEEKTAKEKAEAEAKAKEASIPREHKAALKKAELYAETMYMSKAGIYDQLTSEYGENFPPEAAQYAIDNIQFDWKKGALKKARTYAETMSMSDSAIYDQLISDYGEKFTPEEAQYAIDNL